MLENAELFSPQARLVKLGDLACLHIKWLLFLVIIYFIHVIID